MLRESLGLSTSELMNSTPSPGLGASDCPNPDAYRLKPKPHIILYASQNIPELTGPLPEIPDCKLSDEARGWRPQRDWTRLWRPPSGGRRSSLHIQV